MPEKADPVSGETWMREATYTGLDGQKFAVQYDAFAPCIACGLPVMEASMGGTVLCPWCDTGYNRTGDRIVRPRKATQAEYDATIDRILHRCVQCGSRLHGGHRWPTGFTSCSDCYGSDFR